MVLVVNKECEATENYYCKAQWESIKKGRTEELNMTKKSEKKKS